MLHISVGASGNDETRKTAGSKTLHELDGILAELRSKLVKAGSRSVHDSDEQESPSDLFQSLNLNFDRILPTKPDVLSYETVKALMFEVRDKTAQLVHNDLLGSLRTVAGEMASLEPPVMLSDPEREWHKTFEEKWKNYPLQVTESYFSLQKRITEYEGKIVRLASQLHDIISQCSASRDPLEHYGPTVLKILSKILSNVRERVRKYKKTQTETQKIRREALYTLIKTLEDIFSGARDDAQGIVVQHHQFRREAEETWQRTGGFEDTFPRLWQDMLEDFQRWLSQVPPDLQMTGNTVRYLQQCDAKDDDCCLKRVDTMKRHVERMLSALEMNNDQERNSNSVVLQADECIRTTQLEEQKEELARVRKEIKEISRAREQFWGGSGTAIDIDALATLESKEPELKKHESELASEIESVPKKHCEPNGSHGSQRDAYVQGKLWLSRLGEFETLCREEARQWEEKRAPAYRMRRALRDETIKTFRDLNSNIMDKIDGAGYTLSSEAAKHIRSLLTALHEETKKIDSENALAFTSLRHYSVRSSTDTNPLHYRFAMTLRTYQETLDSLADAITNSERMVLLSETVSGLISFIKTVDKWKTTLVSD